jgi:hypothetical protein
MAKLAGLPYSKLPPLSSFSGGLASYENDAFVCAALERLARRSGLVWSAARQLIGG